MNLKEEYQKIIAEFIEATKSGKLNWKKQNPTTVFIETISNTDKAIISLQKVVVRGGTTVVRTGVQRVVRRETQVNFVFTVKNATSNELVIQIDTGTDPTFKERLAELFNACEFNTEKKNMDFLKGIISGLGDKTD